MSTRTLTKKHRKAISKACRDNPIYMENVRRPRSNEWKAAISASNRCDRLTEPEKWQKFYELALQRLALAEAEELIAAS